jgi:hypothetical protein
MLSFNVSDDALIVYNEGVFRPWISGGGKPSSAAADGKSATSPARCSVAPPASYPPTAGSF